MTSASLENELSLAGLSLENEPSLEGLTDLELLISRTVENSESIKKVFKDSDLSGIDYDLSHILFSNLNFENVNFSSSTIFISLLLSNNFNRCFFIKTKFREMRLTEANFIDCSLENALFYECMFIGSSRFVGSSLSNIDIPDTNNTIEELVSLVSNNMDNSYMEKYTIFERTSFIKSYERYVIFNFEQGEENHVFANIEQMRYCFFKGSVTGISSIRSTIMYSMCFRRLTLCNVIFKYNLYLNYSIFEEATLNKVIFFSFLDLPFPQQPSIIFLENAIFKGAKLTDVFFLGCKLKKTIFEGATLTNVSFIKCDLTGAIFRGATLNNLDFSNSTLTRESFEGATLNDVDFTSTILNPEYERQERERQERERIERERIERERQRQRVERERQERERQERQRQERERIERERQQRLEQPQRRGRVRGLAYEVHDMFQQKFLPVIPRYLELINQPPFTGTRDELNELINNFFTENINRLYSDNPTEKRTKLQQLEQVKAQSSGFIRSRNVSDETASLIAQSLSFVNQQDDDFKREYIITFLNESCVASQGLMSCSDGVIERFMLNIASTVGIICTHNQENETYNALNTLLNEKVDKVELAKAWWDRWEDSEELKSIPVEERKQRFIRDLIDEARQSFGYSPGVDEEIRKYADEWDYAFKNMMRGGGNKRTIWGKKRATRKNVIFKQNKRRKLTKRINGKRQRKSKRYNGKSKKNNKKTKRRKLHN